MKDFLLKRSINDQKDNIREFPIPYDVLMRDATIEERKMVVFLGDNFVDLPGTDLKEVSRITNLCLDYVRRECEGHELYYKPHPRAQSKPSHGNNSLDLSGFKIENSRTAELFYLKNIKKIKYIFATCSGGSRTAYDMGLNSYSFLNLISPTFDIKTRQGENEAFQKMPPSCFIDDLSQPLKENKKKFIDGSMGEQHIREVFIKKSGSVWILLSDTGTLAAVVALTALIRKIDPERMVNLVAVRHHRWDVIPTEDIEEYFDNIFFVPRIFYSLRPRKIYKAIKAARAIKKFPINPDDIILEVPGLGFAADCFTSYFRNNIRVVMLSQDVFKISCEEQKYSRTIFRTRPGATFFNLIVEPILGLERTRWLEDKRRIFNVDRYARSMNDVFDYVWIF